MKGGEKPQSSDESPADARGWRTWYNWKSEAISEVASTQSSNGFPIVVRMKM